MIDTCILLHTVYGSAIKWIINMFQGFSAEHSAALPRSGAWGGGDDVHVQGLQTVKGKVKNLLNTIALENELVCL